MAKLARAAGVSRYPSAPRKDSCGTHFHTSRIGQCKSTRPTLLWIHDFAPALALYRAMFENLGFRVLTATSGKAGVRLTALNRVDIVVTDFEMPEMDGGEVATAVKALSPKTPVLLFSGSSLIPQSARNAVDAYCDKAGSRSELLGAIHRLLQRDAVLQPALPTLASDHGQRTVA